MAGGAEMAGIINFDIGGKSEIHPPFAAKFARWKRQIGPGNCFAIKTEIHAMLAGSQIETTSWMPGRHWQHPFVAIFYALGDEIWAAQCFGLFVWECVFERTGGQGAPVEEEGSTPIAPESWGCKHCDDQWGYPIRGRTYFRLNVPPSRAINPRIRGLMANGGADPGDDDE